MYRERSLNLSKDLEKKSVLLLGPRRTGKSSLINNEIKPDKIYNLLKSDTFLKLSINPAYIRESLTKKDKLIVIDEVQKLPALMDEVHYMIEEHKIKFLLSGSSARKLKRTHTSLMAGRAKTRRLFPFVSDEIPEYDLLKILQYGSLPPVYTSDEPWEELKTYVSDYLKEEIMAEALSRNIGNFSRFLVNAGLANGEIINFESVGNDAQVSSKTVKDYYSILEDTLIGTMVEPYKSKGKRKTIAKGKFYFFDIGVVNAITDQKHIAENTSAFGNSFEHFIFLELFAYSNYMKKDIPINFWRTSTGDEVDFIIGDSIAIEVKASKLASEKHFKGLIALSKEQKFKRKIIISRDEQKRLVKGIEIYPYKQFLQELWAGEIF